MFKKLLGFLLFLWIIALFSMSGYLFWQAKDPNMEFLNKEVALIIEQERGKENFQESLLNRLPKLFSYEPALVSVFLGDENDDLLGSMFDKNRLPENKYRILQQRFSEVVEKGLGGNYSLIKMTSQEHKINIYLVFKVKINYQEVLQKIFKNNPNIFSGFVIYAILGIFLIILYLLFSNRNKKKTLNQVQNSEIDSEKKNKDLQESALLKKEDDRNIKQDLQKSQSIEEKSNLSSMVKQSTNIDSLPSIFFSEEALLKAMSLFAKTTLANQISFYSFSSDTQNSKKWKFQATLRGTLLSRGEGSDSEKNLSSLQEASYEAADIFWNEIDKEVIFLFKNSSQKEKKILPNHQEKNSEEKKQEERQLIEGAFFLKFSAENFLKLEKKSIIKMLKELTHSLSLQQSFAQASIDKNMGLYTYPYFLFAVKEKLAADGNFYTLILKIKNYVAKGKNLWQEWNIFRNEFFSKKIKYHPVCAWLENDRILLNLDQKKFLNKEHMIKICSEFIIKSQKITSEKIPAALVEGSKQNAETFLSTLSLALQKAEQKDKLIVVSKESSN